MIAAVSELIRSLKVTTTSAATAKLIAPLADVATALVRNVSATALVPVVNVLVVETTAVPAKSVKPPICSVYTVDGCNGAAGVNRTTVLPLSTLAVPAIADPPPGVTVIALDLTVAALIGALSFA